MDFSRSAKENFDQLARVDFDSTNRVKLWLRSQERLWDTLHTALDRSIVGHYAQSAVVGVARQRPVGGTTVTTDAATSSVRT